MVALGRQLKTSYCAHYAAKQLVVAPKTHCKRINDKLKTPLPLKQTKNHRRIYDGMAQDDSNKYFKTTERERKTQIDRVGGYQKKIPYYYRSLQCQCQWWNLNEMAIKSSPTECD